MKSDIKRFFCLLTICFSVALIIISCKNKKNIDLIDYVNPNIGTIGHLCVSTESIVQLPHGMVQVGQNPYPEMSDRYLADKISSFSLRALPSYTTKTVPSWIMATTGVPLFKAGEVASMFDHNFEIVTPYYSSVVLEDYQITVENTVTEHASYYQFSFPKSTESNILFGNNSKIKILGDTAISSIENIGRGQKAYFYALFNKPFLSANSWNGNEISGQPQQLGDSIGVIATFETRKEEKIEVKVGVSCIDMEQAMKNLETEIPAWNFDQTKKRAKDIWNKSLRRIQIKGGTEEERIKFYSALYRVMLGNQSVNLTEYGRYFSPYDKTVHSSDGHDFYRLESNWGSHHSLFPLFLLLEPEKQNDMLCSYVRMEEQNSWLSNSGGHRGMIGRHEAATIIDAYLKGFQDFDIEKAYSAMKRNSMKATMLSRHRGDDWGLTELDSVYLEKGFFPAIPSGEKEWVPQVAFGRQAVSITLENCYDDWLMSILAKQLGKNDDYIYFLKRAHNYQNVFDPVTGFMRPKTADGKWIEPFDPIWSGGQAGRDYYTENNGWNYTFYVPHDVKGLITLSGGRQEFVNKLNKLFNTTVPLYEKYTFLDQYPDMTGWIGMYSHGNEVTWHIPYLYNYAGAPWMTQRRVRQIMDLWYGSGPLGMCGDEDYGEMSSWYVLSAMGFYTVAPGSTIYDIGSPLFEEVAINIGNGKTFVVEAKNVSKQNKYIQSAELNGEKIDRPWFSHEELMRGGRLALIMGPQPNKSWGASPDAAPFSMSK